MSEKPKILLLDIETSPAKAYIWSMWDKFVPLERLIEAPRVLCAAYKFVGEKDVEFVSEWTDTRVGMLENLNYVLSLADAVVTYNGDKFDLQKLNGEFVAEGLEPMAPVTSIDLYKTIKKLGYISGKLEYIGPFLKIGEKVKHEGFSLWKNVLSGVPDARAKMERYNVGDVRLLDKLYAYLKPYISTHPRLKDTPITHCPVCRGSNTQHRGYRRTKTYRIERIWCKDCPHWFKGKKQKIG